MSRVLSGMNLSLFALTIFAVACSDKESANAIQKVPLAGLDTLPQLVVVKDSTAPASKSWMEPDLDSFAADFPAHVTVERVSSEAVATEKFNVYNGRPVDFLLVGQGIPQKVFAGLKLPKNQGRVTFILNPEQKIEEAIALEFSSTSIRKWASDFCAQKFLTLSCDFQPADVFSGLKSVKNSERGEFLLAFGSRKLEVDARGRSVLLSVFIDWDAFFRKQLLDRRANAHSIQGNVSLSLGPSSPFLRFENGDALKTLDPKLQQGVEDYKRSSILKLLGSGSTRQSSPVTLELIQKSAPKASESK